MEHRLSRYVFNNYVFNQEENFFDRTPMANRRIKQVLLTQKRVVLYDTQDNLGIGGVFSSPRAGSVDGEAVDPSDWIDVSDFATVQLWFAADEAGATLIIFTSPDPSDAAWTETEYTGTTIAADAQTDQIVTPKFRYLRLVETNGATAQTGKTLTLWGLQ